MPFKSEAQRRYMFAKHPKIAKRWSKETPKGEKLSDKITPEDTIKKATDAIAAMRLIRRWAKVAARSSE